MREEDRKVEKMKTKMNYEQAREGKSKRTEN